MVVEAASIATELAAIVTRRPPLLPLEGVDMIRYGQHFDSSKARAELGLATRPLTETLADAMSWFRAQGRI
jgi:dihydroflavonol-4-reductase